MLAAMAEKRASREVAKAVDRAFETGQSQTVSVPVLETGGIRLETGGIRLEVLELDGGGGVVETKDD
jgi:hypothetical protein